MMMSSHVIIKTWSNGSLDLADPNFCSENINFLRGYNFVDIGCILTVSSEEPYRNKEKETKV